MRNVFPCVLLAVILVGCDEVVDDPEDLCQNVECGDHGTCDSETGSCECDDDYRGELCDQEIHDVDCGDNGRYDPESDICECESGYVGERCESCDDGHMLEDEICVPVECTEDAHCDDEMGCNGSEICDDNRCAAGDPIVCGDHETCREPEGVCECESGYQLVEDECTREVLADFEDLTLDVESFWNGDDGSGSFQSGSTIFFNSYVADWEAWDGFAYSNWTDRTTTGLENQYSAIAGSGVEGSSIYGVAYFIDFSILGPPTLSFTNAGEGVVISGAYVTNTTFTYISMRDGDSYCKKFGGDDGTDPDWYLLSIQGVTAAGELTDPAEFYLADFRSENSDDDYIIDDWTWVELSGLGEIVGLQFGLSSSDTGDWGMNTPAYFAIDGIMRYGR